MKIEKIKPIPKYIREKIHQYDKKFYNGTYARNHFYSYLTKNDGELVKVTVAVKVKKGVWYCKQVAVHGVHSDKCFVKDMYYSNIGGYSVGWHAEGLTSYIVWQWKMIIRTQSNEWRKRISATNLDLKRTRKPP